MYPDTETVIETTTGQTEVATISAGINQWKPENRYARYYRERGELAGKYVNLILSHNGGYGDYDWIVDMHKKEYEFLKLCYSDLFMLN